MPRPIVIFDFEVDAKFVGASEMMKVLLGQCLFTWMHMVRAG